MSIFIDKAALIPIIVKFIPVLDDKGRLFACKVLRDDAEDDNVKVLICYTRGRDYEKYSQILEEVTVINHITGEPVITARHYYQLLASNFFSTWGVFKTVEEAEKAAEENKLNIITDEAIKGTDFSIIRALGVKWIKIVSGVGKRNG